MRTEEVELDNRFGEQYAGRYAFQEITWAKRSRIIQKHTKYHPMSGQLISSDLVAIQAETIWASLRTQPDSKPISLQRLLGEDEGIPIELGEVFSRIANRLCGITPSEQRFLSEPSEGGKPIQHSLNSDSAKNWGSCPARSGESQQETSSG